MPASVSTFFSSVNLARLWRLGLASLCASRSPTLTRTTDVSSSAAAVDMLFASVFTVVAAVGGTVVLLPLLEIYFKT